MGKRYDHLVAEERGTKYRGFFEGRGQSLGRRRLGRSLVAVRAAREDGRL